MADDTVDKPWQRLPNEPAKAFRAFSLYLERGADRTQKAVAETLGVSHELITKWSNNHDWYGRAERWDNRNADVAQAARDKVNAERAAEWERRRVTECEDLYRLGQMVRAKAIQMVESALYTRREKDGKTLVKPANWTFATAASMARQSAELVALAIGEALEPEDFDPTDHTPEECEAYVRRVTARKKTVRDALSGKFKAADE